MALAEKAAIKKASLHDITNPDSRMVRFTVYTNGRVTSCTVRSVTEVIAATRRCASTPEYMGDFALHISGPHPLMGWVFKNGDIGL
jgi:hypothetical protein